MTIAHSRGFALMLVIWSLVLMTTLATAFAYAVRHETRSAGDLASHVRAEAALEGALRLSVLGITATDNDFVPWTADGRQRDLAWPGADVRVRVRMPHARIDLNQAPREVLAGLFAQFADPEGPEPLALADAVIDWRDQDDRPEPLGAEYDAYADAGLDHAPGNRPFATVHELGQVIGFRYAQLEAVLPHVTVQGGSNRVHAGSADAAVLAAIPGIVTEDAQRYVELREAALTAEDLPDDRLLQDGRRYIDVEEVRGAGAYLLDISVRQPDGYALHELVELVLAPETGFVELSRQRIPPQSPSEDPL